VIRLTALAVAFVALVGIGAAVAGTDEPPSGTSILYDLGFSLSGGSPDKQTMRKGLLVPTPWGEVEATVVSTAIDRMVRVPLSPNTDAGQSRFQPYVTAGSRKNVDSDPVLQQARPSAFADSGRTNLKAGAGVIFKLDDNIELFGEYQFMRLQRDVEGRGTPGPVGTTLDAGGFSLGLSVRY
jgi:opacity protein-like surface antigen